MKNKIILKTIIEFAVLLFMINITGCSSNTENIKQKESVKVEKMDTQKNDINNKIFADIYRNKIKFYDTESKRNIYLKDYSSSNYMIGGKDAKYKYISKEYEQVEDLNIISWCETDMNSDGEEELLIKLSSTNILVLHRDNEVVYGYAFPFRGMNSIKTDGTYQCSGSAANTYIRKLEFNNGECFYNEICAIDELDGNNPIYRINQKERTKEAVRSYLEQQELKENVLWNEIDENK